MMNKNSVSLFFFKKKKKRLTVYAAIAPYKNVKETLARDI